MKEISAGPEWLTPAEVAAIFRVETKTIARWANEGKLPAIRTLGGHRRYNRSVIERVLNGEPSDLPE